MTDDEKNITPRNPSAIRFVFSVTDGVVTLQSRHYVAMRAPRSSALGDATPTPAFAAELRDRGDQTLYRVALANPLEGHREVFSDEPGRSVHRVPIENPGGAFTVVVPIHPDAQHIVLVAAPPATHAAGLKAVSEPSELARFPLNEPGDRSGGA